MKSTGINRVVVWKILFGCLLVLCAIPQPAAAQIDAGVDVPQGVTPWLRDASVTVVADGNTNGNPGQTDGAVSNSQALPPGHPTVDQPGSEPGQRSNVRSVSLAESWVRDAPDLPSGTVHVGVVDFNGNRVPDMRVRLGGMRDGVALRARFVNTNADGIAVFSGLESGPTINYRATVEFQSAKFESTPFPLQPGSGRRVQLVKFDVADDSQGILVSHVVVEVAFSDDRLLINQRIGLVNYSSVSGDGTEPHPYAYVPGPAGLRFRLPDNPLVFRAEQTMGDQRVTEENGFAVFRGTLIPTGHERALEIAFQYRVRFDDPEYSFVLGSPVPVLSATVAIQAPQGLQLRVPEIERVFIARAANISPQDISENPAFRCSESTVEHAINGRLMPAVECSQAVMEETFRNQHVLLISRGHRPGVEPTLTEIHVQLQGIPPAAGTERTVAVVLALLVVVASIFATVRRQQFASATVTVTQRDAQTKTALIERQKHLLNRVTELEEQHAREEIGPETYSRRRRELTLELAMVLATLTKLEQNDKAVTEKRAGKKK